MHQVFEPTARAITGLERALEAVGLLDEALALDLRRPQDYFGRLVHRFPSCGPHRGNEDRRR